MSRRNLLLLMAAAVISLVCYQKVQSNRYGRTLLDAMDLVERQHLYAIEQQELFEGAMDGMIDRLGDPYSAFVSPKDFAQFKEVIDQKFGGVGIEVSLDPDTSQLTVMSPLVGTPAYEAGIRAGDKILRIDGKSTRGLDLQGAVTLMRGDPGEEVELSILHPGDEQPVDITIERAIIRIDTVLGDTREADGSWRLFLEGHDRIGYLRINSFAEKTSEELDEALEWLIANRVEGLILDLRNDPGGLLLAAVEVCDKFIDSGIIVTTRDRRERIVDSYQASKNGTFNDFPMAVLVNQHSASASEIVAACLQDHQRAVVIGQRTWGKGTVQEVIELDSKRGALRLTTSSYWRPSGKNIHRRKDDEEDKEWGVKPDQGHEVVVEGEDFEKLLLDRRRRDRYLPAENGEQPGPPQNEPFTDHQLQKAIEYIEKEIAEKKFS